MKKTAKYQSQPLDIKLLFPVIFLVGIGIVMIYSASSALALKKYGNSFYFLFRQMSYAAVGICMMLLFSYLPYRILRIFTYGFLILSFVLLAATQLSGLGFTAGGAARWIHIGSFSFQPSEFARFSLIIYLAYSLSKKEEKVKHFSIGFVPHVIVLMSYAIVIALQPDFGSIVILCSLTWIMMFVGGVKIRYLFLTVLPLIVVGYFYMINADYRMDRLKSFQDPWKYKSEEGYQLIQSLLAFGTGGVWGTGIGQGYQKLFYLPEPHTDFIFSVIGEELGMVGALCIVSLYIMIWWRGLWIGMQTEDRFGSLVAVGLSTAIISQVAINMGVTLGLLPTKGLTLPFLSYGGSSLLLNLISVGILLNIGANRKR
ncbi:MAG: putative lipid II flippase FtsW [Desulfobacterales bacterium]|nr:putative lipid II flippase FtsW [Desulfobacterales bacterium]